MTLPAYFEGYYILAILFAMLGVCLLLYYFLYGVSQRISKVGSWKMVISARMWPSASILPKKMTSARGETQKVTQ